MFFSGLTLLITLVAACTHVPPNNKTNASDNSFIEGLGAKKIAYLRYTNDFWQVWVTDVNGNIQEQLTSDEVDKSRISWSSELGLLLVNSNDGKLLLLDVQTKKKTPASVDSLEVFDAQLSPDGTQIAYTATTSLQADNAEVWVADLNGATKRKITNNTAVTLYPSWNPKDNSILYSAGAPGKNQELWRASLQAATQSEQLTISPFSSLDPNANSAGEILYSSDQTGYYNIWLLNETQKQRQITNSTSYDAQPVWNQSGTAFVFFRILSNKKQIWVYDMSSGIEFPITPDTVLSRGAVWID